MCGHRKRPPYHETHVCANSLARTHIYRPCCYDAHRCCCKKKKKQQVSSSETEFDAVETAVSPYQLQPKPRPLSPQPSPRALSARASSARASSAGASSARASSAGASSARPSSARPSRVGSVSSQLHDAVHNSYLLDRGIKPAAIQRVSVFTSYRPIYVHIMFLVCISCCRVISQICLCLIRSSVNCRQFDFLRSSYILQAKQIDAVCRVLLPASYTICIAYLWAVIP